MKRLIAAVSIAVLLLCGCQTKNAYMEPYTASGSSKTTDTSSLLQSATAQGVSSDVAVVSNEENNTGSYSNRLTSVQATEIFLTGTTQNDVIASSNIFHEMPPASLTKIMTALVALKYGPDMDEQITLTDEMYVTVDDAQICYFQSGDVISMHDLFYAMLIYSGNDAANAVAIATAGDIASFCDLMNEEASKLGATHTHFVTPHGLDDPNHYSTAYDLYLIFKECLKYDTFKDAIAQSSITVGIQRGDLTLGEKYKSTNLYKLGEASPPAGITIIGGKTGTTDNAGLCLILYSEDADKEGYISVLLGCENKTVLYNSMTNLLSLVHN